MLLQLCSSQALTSLFTPPLHPTTTQPLTSLPSGDDKTRVAIGENQEYINASYIRMQVGEEEFFYISCQGPLPSTVPAFWQMIWENKSDVVAMMTQEVERGRVKCHRYWPEKPGIPQDTGRYLLHLENQQNLEHFQIKIIRMVEKEVRVRFWRSLPADGSYQTPTEGFLYQIVSRVLLEAGSRDTSWWKQVHVSLAAAKETSMSATVAAVLSNMDRK